MHILKTTHVSADQPGAVVKGFALSMLGVRKPGSGQLAETAPLKTLQQNRVAMISTHRCPTFAPRSPQRGRSQGGHIVGNALSTVFTVSRG